MGMLSFFFGERKESSTSHERMQDLREEAKMLKILPREGENTRATKEEKRYERFKKVFEVKSIEELIEAIGEIKFFNMKARKVEYHYKDKDIPVEFKNSSAEILIRKFVRTTLEFKRKMDKIEKVVIHAEYIPLSEIPYYKEDREGFLKYLYHSVMEK